MADSITRQVYDGVRNFSIKLTNISDGTGETLVKKIDVTTLVPNPGAHMKIRRAQYSIYGGEVVLYWEGTPNTPMLVLTPGNGVAEFEGIYAGGYPDNSTSPTGNVLLSTMGFVLNSSYSIELDFIKGVSAN